MTRIVVTEITRFANNKIVCSAGIDVTTGHCYRPMPYLSSDRCRELGMVPGAILSGEFAPAPGSEAPHVEDMNYQNLTYHGPCSNDEFREVMANSAVDTVEGGFGITMQAAEKCIDSSMRPRRSLMTLKVDPRSVSLVPDQFNNANVKAHFADSSGKQFRFITVTDLGINDLVCRVGSTQVCEESQQVLRQQPDVYIRLGLSRHYQAPNGKAGYWLQVNGLYSFPDFYRAARQYR